MEHMTQVAPYPAELADLVRRCRYRAHEGWRIDLIDDCQRDKDRDGRVIGHGLTLSVLTKGYDAYHPENDRTYRVYHYFIVPAATYNRASWMRWLFDQFGHVEDHERMENFTLVDDSLTEPEDECTCGHAATRHDGRISQCLECGEQEHRYEAKQPRLARPFAPTHGPGDDPYVVHEYATAVQRRTRYTGKMLPERHL